MEYFATELAAAIKLLAGLNDQRPMPVFSFLQK